MATHVYHTTINYIDPLYPDILDQYIGKRFICDTMPLIIKNNIRIQVNTPCDTAARVKTAYYAPKEGGIKIASKPYNTYMTLNVHLENFGNEDQVLTPGMRIWITSKLRDNDLDFLSVGPTYNVGNIGSIGLMLPPFEPRFAV